MAEPLSLVSPSRRRVLGLVILALVLLAGSALVFVATHPAPSVMHQGKTLEEWLAQLETPDPAARQAANEALRTLDLSSTPALIRALRTGDPWLKKPFLTWRSKLPPALNLRLFRLIQPFAAEDLRRRATMAFNLIPKVPLEAAPALARELTDADRRAAVLAAQALARMGEGGMPPLIAALEGPHEFARDAAFVALREVGSAADAAVPAFLQLLATAQGNALGLAQEALARRGPAAVAPLVASLGSPYAEMRRRAAETLLRTCSGSPEALSRFMALLPSQPVDVRRAMVPIIARTEPHTKVNAVYLARLISDPDHEVRLLAGNQIDTELAAARFAVPELIKALGSSQNETRALASSALGRLGPGAKEAASALQALSADPDPNVRQEAASALERIAVSPALVPRP